MPAIPNAEAAAIRCPPTAGHGVRVFASRKPWLSQSISRLASDGVQGGWDGAVFGGDQNLGQPERPAGGQRVTHVGFHRTQQRTAAGFGVAVGLRQRPQFGAVAEPGTGAVPLDHPDFFGPDPGLA